MNIRETIEKWEQETLSPYASLSANTRGRERKEPLCDIRPEYQRDRDRILHSKSFRRLKQKTQVFLAPEGDHYRTRLTHTLEVSQIARTIAKALRLNLTWEVRNGILNHRTSGHPATLEGNVVRLSDKIAYINHDIDDAIRGKIMKEEDLPREYTDILGNSVHERLNIMIHDIIEHSQDKPEVAMSPEREEAMHGLRRWMFDHVYHDGIAKAEEGRAQQMIEMLYGYYMAHPEELPEESHRIMEMRNETKERAVCDYIAGMTDIYAIDRFKELFIPKAWSV
ncbi:deoxyguanosinetriphosphate triphosphohydrolase [Clostridium sp. TF11-13AC]|uniref:deoxyguanosinetriphosphate triphosphohydrolase n=1 Tax=Clostridium sp. TF11-13AC TaxID=2293053 RepID=UPI000E4ACF29|nr:deoxyguanosinetriphosphate triphosphohydrolase [Clostridium sp. TF11-13AC]RHU41878.1 deoxyguanosinetriphosphate triphosphohydrolase [Clostridium sp. TF11-13AC]